MLRCVKCVVFLVSVLLFGASCTRQYVAIHSVRQLAVPGNNAVSCVFEFEYISKTKIMKYQTVPDEQAGSAGGKRRPYVSVFLVRIKNPQAGARCVIDVAKARLSYATVTNLCYTYQDFYRRFPSFDYDAIAYYPFLFYSDGGHRLKLEQHLAVDPGREITCFMVFDAIAENCTTFSIVLPVKQGSENTTVSFSFTNSMERRSRN